MQRTPPAADESINNTPHTSNKRLRVDDQGWKKSPSAESDKNENSITLEGMMKTMMEQFSATRLLIDTVRSEIKDVNNKIDTVKNELKSDIKAVKEECAAKFQHHDAVLDTINKRVDGLSHSCGFLEKRNELIISGIPSRTGENLDATLKEIGRYLAMRDAENLMAKTRRMNSGKNDVDGLVVVEFALKTTRDEFYSAYLRKRDLKLRHIGLDSDHRVYINESLTIEARKLKSAALHRKKAGKLAMVYTKQGVVYVKAAVTGPSIAVQSEVDLDKLL